MAAGTTVVVAPHPDDETLGCGGTLLREVAAGRALHWLLMTATPIKTDVECQSEEIEAVKLAYPFQEKHWMHWPATHLDEGGLGGLVSPLGIVLRSICPEIVYLPYPGDAHSDHRVTFEAVSACVKWFCLPSVRRVLCYETLSSTESAVNPWGCFKPNVYVDITEVLERKLEIAALYRSQMGEFPFPRSEGGIRALAAVRGLESGYKAAEAFMLLRERS